MARSERSLEFSKSDWARSTRDWTLQERSASDWLGQIDSH